MKDMMIPIYRLYILYRLERWVFCLELLVNVITIVLLLKALRVQKRPSGIFQKRQASSSWTLKQLLYWVIMAVGINLLEITMVTMILLGCWWQIPPHWWVFADALLSLGAGIWKGLYWQRYGQIVWAYAKYVATQPILCQQSV
jgi:hypothetical protein